MILSNQELNELGFRSIGQDVRIDRRAAIFGAPFISLGSHIRIDCFAVITAGPSLVSIGSFSHVAAHTYISGAQGGVVLGYGVGLAPFVALYSAVEDYTSGFLTNPSIPPELRKTDIGRIEILPHSALGSGAVVLCGKRVGFATSVGALSLVNRRVRDFEVVHGNPIRRVGTRPKGEILQRDLTLIGIAESEGIDLNWRDGENR